MKKLRELASWVTGGRQYEVEKAERERPWLKCSSCPVEEPQGGKDEKARSCGADGA